MKKKNRRNSKLISLFNNQDKSRESLPTYSANQDILNLFRSHFQDHNNNPLTVKELLRNSSPLYDIYQGVLEDEIY